MAMNYWIEYDKFTNKFYILIRYILSQRTSKQYTEHNPVTYVYNQFKVSQCQLEMLTFANSNYLTSSGNTPMFMKIIGQISRNYSILNLSLDEMLGFVSTSEFQALCLIDWFYGCEFGIYCLTRLAELRMAFQRNITEEIQISRDFLRT